jgi:hypothetical protein
LGSPFATDSGFGGRQQGPFPFIRPGCLMLEAATTRCGRIIHSTIQFCESRWSVAMTKSPTVRLDNVDIVALPQKHHSRLELPTSIYPYRSIEEVTQVNLQNERG